MLSGRLLALALLLSCGSVDAARETVTPKQRFEARQAELGAITKELSGATDLLFADAFDEAPANTCSADRDADRLADCVETGTGVFVDANDTGTSPDNADTDGDQLIDGDEVHPTQDGLDLAALGANPLRRTLLIEYDWFDDSLQCGWHSHVPTAAMLARVERLFAAAPVTNPDGSTGITVIQDAGQGAPFLGGNPVIGHDPVLPGTFDDTYNAIKSANFAAKRAGYFHYVLMPHHYAAGSSSSGYAEIVGDDAIVSLGCYASNTVYVSNTIVHELGHNLGLLHGGFEECNGKPNYSSLMNYRYQFYGIDAECQGVGDPEAADFSHGNRLSLDENALDEPQGACGNLPIDWNVDGALASDLTYDLNGAHNAVCGGQLTVLDDFDDWANITFGGVLDPVGVLKNVKSEVACAGAPAPPGKTAPERM